MRFDKAKFPYQYALGVVYAANERDFHGDTMTPEELEQAAWRALGKNVRVGLMHRPGTAGAGKVVESYIYRGPRWKVRDVTGHEQIVESGDWIMGTVWNDQAWDAIMRGELTGYSLQGVARTDEHWNTSKSKGAKHMRAPMHDAKKSMFRSIIFGPDVREFDLENMNESVDDRMRVMSDEAEAVVAEMNASMSAALEAWAGKGDVVTRQPEDRATPNFRRDADGSSLPMRPGKNFEQPSPPYKMLLEDGEADMDYPTTSNWLGDRLSDPTARPGRAQFPGPSDRVGGLVRKREGRFGTSFIDIVFGNN